MSRFSFVEMYSPEKLNKRVRDGVRVKARDSRGNRQQNPIYTDPNPNPDPYPYPNLYPNPNPYPEQTFASIASSLHTTF
jgi:hypothetical protein